MIQHGIQIGLLVLALLCIWHGWRVADPYGGDAGLVDALEQIFSYAMAVLLVIIAGVWFMAQKFT